MILQVAASVPLAFVLWSLTTLYLNYVKARQIGLPIVFSPFDAQNPLWFAFKKPLRPLIRKLPFNLSSLFVRLEANWTFRDRYNHHARYGPAFTELSPGGIRIFFADAATMEDYSKRRNDFIKPPEVYFALELYGPNLDTVNGRTWERHRKITVPPFNEKNSALVWQSTLNQASQMLESWRSCDVVSSTHSDINSLALNVLCFAGFGVSNRFISQLTATAEPASISGNFRRYGSRESLRILLEDFISLVMHHILIQSGYPARYMWGKLAILTSVKAEFKSYMDELILNERTFYEQGTLDRHNLLSTLIRADVEAKKTLSTTIDKRTGTTGITMKGLTDAEIYGNLFIYNLAGHDTTAGTLQFALLQLAIEPELQKWVAEEVDAVRKVSQATGDADFFYESTFPQLRRCLALMYESLRLYGPVQVLPRRTTHESDQPLTISGRTYIIPRSTPVVANFSAIHTNPNYWNADALEFRPQRFISTSVAMGQPSNLDEEQLVSPAAGTFVPWNRGPRLCPGQKFSQVEFVGTVFVLFASGSRVELVKKKGETAADAADRAKELVNSATMEATLKLPKDIDVRWVKS